ALDLDGSMFAAFGVPARPHTVIVDATGKIAAMTTPEYMTADAIEKVLSGKAAGISVRPMGVPNLDWDLEEIDWRDGIAPEFQFILKPVQMAAGGHVYRPGSNRFAADGARLANLIQAAFETDYFHVDCRTPLPDQTYRVTVVVPRGRESALLPFFRSALTAAFGLKTRWETQDKEVYVLRGPGSVKASLRESEAGEETFYFMRGKIVGKKQPITRLVEALTNFLHKPVVDESGLMARYDWELSYDPTDKEVLMKEIRDTLGLELALAVRPVRILVVEKADTAAKQAAQPGKF
ncbi:MAG: TIGR03435 family protein, partial [Candidatus Hadarchaeota archaeon]